MPSILKIIIHSARNLSTEGGELPDTLTEITFSRLTPRKTDVVKASRDPDWRNASFKLEISDDNELATSPLVLRVTDRDLMREVVIGTVSISLEPLLRGANAGSVNTQHQHQHPHLHHFVASAPTLDSWIRENGIEVGGGSAQDNLNDMEVDSGGAAPSGAISSSSTVDDNNGQLGLVRSGGRPQISGWFPIFDTLLGVRGMLKVTVELRTLTAGVSGPISTQTSASAGVSGSADDDIMETASGGVIGQKGELISTAQGDLNDHHHANTSAGRLSKVHLFSLDRLDTRIFPYQVYRGFVEEILVHSDPEHQSQAVQANVSSSRAELTRKLFKGTTAIETAQQQLQLQARRTNELRQLVLHKLAYSLRNNLANKAASIGANAVVGMQLHFDVESRRGTVVGRAFGTAMAIYRPRLADDPLHTVLRTEALAYQQKIQMLSRSSPASMMRSSSAGQLHPSATSAVPSVSFSTHPNAQPVIVPITANASPVIKSSSSPTLQPLEPLDISSIEASGRERTTSSSSFLSMRGREKTGTSNDRDRGTTAYATDAIAAAIDAALFELIDNPQSISETPTPLASNDAPTPSFLSFTKESSMLTARSFASSQNSPQAPISSSMIKTAFEAASETAPSSLSSENQLPHLALVAAAVAQQVVGGGSLTRNSSIKLLNGTATASSATTSGSGHILKMQRSSSSIPLSIGPSTSTPFIDERTMNKIDRDASNRLRVASAVSQFAPLHRYSTVAEIRRHDSINLLTVSSTPPGSRMHIGGLVAVRTVKFLGFSQKPSKSSERFAVSHSFDQATRDAWWAELRRELREHAAKLGCTQVMGYREETEIQGEACILSVFGTAVRLKNIKSQGQVRTARREIEGDGPGARKRRSALSSEEKRSLRRAWVAEPLRRPWYVKPMSGVFDDAAVAAKSAEAAFSQLREARTSLLALRSSSSGSLAKDLPLLNEEREDEEFEERGRSLSMSALSTRPTPLYQLNESSSQSLSVKALVEEKELLASLALKAPGSKKKAILAAAAASALTSKITSATTTATNGATLSNQSAQVSSSAQAPLPQQHLQSVASTALLIGRFKQHPTYAVSKLSESHDLCVLPPGLVSNDPLCAPSAPAQLPCSYVHLRSSLSIGSTVSQAPFDNMVTSRCRCCGVGFVPNVLLASIEPPPSLPTAGPGIYIEARAVRRKPSSSKGVNECIVLSEDLVFLEQAMHQQLMLKLRAWGRNAIFSVRSSVAFQSNLVIGSISGTAILVSAMPPPGPFSLRRDMKEDVRGLFDDLQARSKRYRETLSQHIEHSDFAANALIPRAVLNFSDTRVKYIKHRRIALKALKARRALIVAALDTARDQTQPFDTMGDDSAELTGASRKSSKLHLRGGSSGKTLSGGSARKADGGASRRKYRDAHPEASPHASVGKSRNSSRGNIRSRSSRNPLKGGVEDDSDDESDSDTDSENTSSSGSDETDSLSEDEKDGGVNKAKTAAKSDDEDDDSDGRSSTESEGSLVKDASLVREKQPSLGKSDQGAFFRRGFRAGVTSNVYGDDDDGDRAAPTIPGALSLPLYLIEVDGDEQADDIENLLDEIEPPPGVNIVSTDAPTSAYVSPDGQGPLLYPLIAPSLASKPSYSAFHARAIKKGKQLVEKRAATAELFTEGQELAAERALDPSIWSSAVTQAKHMRHLHLSLRVKWSDLLTKATSTSSGGNAASNNDEDEDRFLFGGVPSMSAMFTNNGDSHHIGLMNDDESRAKSYPLPQQREGSGGGVSTSQLLVNEDSEGGGSSSRVNFEGENNDAEGEGAGEREGTLFQRIFTTLTGQRDDEDEDEDENDDGTARGGADKTAVGSAEGMSGEESTEYGEESGAGVGLSDGGGGGGHGNGASVRKMDISRTTCLHNAVMGLVYARLRTFAPCTLTGLRISLSLPEPNEVSITVNGTLVQEASAIVSMDPSALVSVFNDENEKQVKEENVNASVVGGGGGVQNSRGSYQFDVVAQAAKVYAKERADRAIVGFKGKFPLLSLPRSSIVLSPASLVEAVALARLRGSEPDATKMVFKDNAVAPTIVLSAHSALQRFLYSLVNSLSHNSTIDENADHLNNHDDARDPVIRDPVAPPALVSTASSASAVQITSGTHLVGFRTVAYLGSLNLVMVREDLSVSANNSQARAPHLAGFLQDVFEESSALACSQAASLGGNALLGFKSKIVETSARGAYQLLVVTADVAYVVVES